MTLQLDNPLFDPVANRYADDLERLANRALDGDIDETEYRKQLERLTVAMILAVFLLGGGDPDSTNGRKFLDEQNKIARDSARALATDLFDGRYSEREGDKPQTADDGKGSLLSRLALWTFVLGKVYSRARVTAVVEAEEEEPSFTWHLGHTEKHCVTCQFLDGKTKTASEWAELAYVGIEPQGTDLVCGGWRCDCRLVEAK